MTDQNFLIFLQNSISQLTEEKTKLQIMYETECQQRNAIYEEKISKLNEIFEELKKENEKLKEENKRLNCKNRKCFSQQNKGFCHTKNCYYDHYCKFNSRCDNNYCKLIHTPSKRNLSPKRSYNDYRHRTPIHSRETSPIRQNRRNYNNISRNVSPVRHNTQNITLSRNAN